MVAWLMYLEIRKEESKKKENESCFLILNQLE